MALLHADGATRAALVITGYDALEPDELRPLWRLWRRVALLEVNIGLAQEHPRPEARPREALRRVLLELPGELHVAVGPCHVGLSQDFFLFPLRILSFIFIYLPSHA